jgi:hypothetical protein
MKVFIRATTITMLIGGSVVGLNGASAADEPKWQIAIDGMPDLSGNLVVVTSGGWNTIYRLSEGSLGITVRVNNRAERHMLSIEDKSTQLKCNGMVSTNTQDKNNTVLIEGSVACGESYRPDSDNLLGLRGSFVTGN